MRISVVINGDTRPGLFSDETEQGRMGSGTRSLDYLKEGIDNKLKFFRGYDIESILYIDVHEKLPKDHLWDIYSRVDDLYLHKHVDYYQETAYFTRHIDLNILTAIISARGDYVAHFDWDMAAFRQNNSEVIDRWVRWLEKDSFDYICYPSLFSPRAVNDKDFSYDWASSRFFFCKRELLDHTEIMKCLNNTDYLYERYAPKDTKRKCPWLEHIQGMMAGKGRVFYPPFLPGDHLIFSWSRYHNGILKTLNESSYDVVNKYVMGKCGGVRYPCDVSGRSEL